MTGYTKLFGSIIGSTIWREDNETRILWITMLACADAHGVIEASIPGLADYARLSVEATEASLKKLLAPDPYSRSQNKEGRRIQEVDGGWILINHAKYRAKLSAEDRREYQRKWREQYRAAGRDKQRPVHSPVDSGRQLSTRSRQAEAEAEAESVSLIAIVGGSGGANSKVTRPPNRTAWKKPTIEEVKLLAFKAELPESEAEYFWNYYESNGWKVGRNPMRSTAAAVANWKRNYEGNVYARNQRNATQNPRDVGTCKPTSNAVEAAKRIEAHTLARQMDRPSSGPPTA